MKRIIQITSGRGPAECGWVVAQVLKLFLAELKNTRIAVVLLHKEDGAIANTVDSVTLQVSGSDENLNEFLKNWVGTIQWVGSSKFRKNHKRKNWFIGVNAIELESGRFSVESSDIRYQATRAGGPGGQHVNKVSTAIRATHIPTGIQVLASNHRSQMQNKKDAKERLIALLEVRRLEDQKLSVKSNWQNHNTLERGNPVRIFKGTDFKSEYVSKSHKSNRQKQKNQLRKIDLNEKLWLFH